MHIAYTCLHINAAFASSTMKLVKTRCVSLVYMYNLVPEINYSWTCNKYVLQKSRESKDDKTTKTMETRIDDKSYKK